MTLGFYCCVCKRATRVPSCYSAVCEAAVAGAGIKSPWWQNQIKQLSPPTCSFKPKMINLWLVGEFSLFALNLLQLLVYKFQCFLKKKRYRAAVKVGMFASNRVKLLLSHVRVWRKYCDNVFENPAECVSQLVAEFSARGNTSCDLCRSVRMNN